ncbi:hypothetical protein [Actinoplanes sp. HUAS TT8]|uniref:hypothetical protein n=1 Tax=Actinoplanes sp. HUAS TT8 TaxID=3447453 RepID=UPI003F51DB1A
MAGAGLFLAGRATVRPPADDGSYADGVRDGRALQATIGRAAGDSEIFRDGYEAGANDAFGGYDGGWSYDTPYAIVLENGGSGITYRISSRVELTPGVDYRLCSDEHRICPVPR